MADPLVVGVGAQQPVRSRPLWWTWLVKLGVSPEASRGTLCPASPSVCVCVVRGVGPYRRYCDEHFPCLGRRPGAPKWVPGWCGCWVGVAVLFKVGWGGWAEFNGVCGADPGGRGRPCVFSDKFQQSESYMFSKVPQIQFIDRAGPPCCATETFTHSANCAKTGDIPQVLFLDKVDDTRCFATTGAWG